MGKDELLKLIGKQIREVRVSKDFTQEEVAHYSNLSRSYYGDIERGTRNVSAINLVCIAKALDVQVGDLFPKI